MRLQAVLERKTIPPAGVKALAYAARGEVNRAAEAGAD